MTMMQAVARTVLTRSTSGRSMSAEGEVSIPQSILDHGIAAWKWVVRKRTQQLATRRLRVAETVSLGEKRFVSIVHVDGTQFLLGGAAGSVSLLAVLETPQEARSVANHPDLATKDQR